jgi:hypothetical protein
MARLEVNGQQVLGVVEEAASVVARLRARLVSKGWQAADIDLFLADFANNAEALAKFANGALDPKTWFFLKERPDWVKKNLNLHEKLKGKDDSFLNRINDFYDPKNFKKVKDCIPPNICGGIPFDEFGFPKFPESSFSNINHRVEILMDGTDSDYLRAYSLLKDKLGAGNIEFTNPTGSSFKIKMSDGTWSEAYTWHHHQDGKSMIPVLQSVHQSVIHTGGRAIVNKGLINLFPWNN